MQLMDLWLFLAIAMLIWGGLLIAETAQQWRRTPEQNLGLIDKGILRIMGADKLPPTWFDHFLNRFRLVRKSIYGLGMLLVGSLIGLTKMGVL